MSEIVTAGILVIGDEILSGRTKDKNIAHLADVMTMAGIDLKEVRIVGDEPTVTRELGNLATATWQAVISRRDRDYLPPKPITILFTDLVAFSTWALDRTDDEIVRLLHAVNRTTAEIVARHGGVVVGHPGTGTGTGNGPGPVVGGSKPPVEKPPVVVGLPPPAAPPAGGPVVRDHRPGGNAYDGSTVIVRDHRHDPAEPPAAGGLEAAGREAEAAPSLRPW